MGAGRAARALEPDFFLPDERGFSDFLKFINRYARHIRYFDALNRPDGDWHEFFMSDEIFLLADIDSYPLEELERRRVDILINFETQTSNEGKLALIRELFSMTFGLMRTVNDWYVLASRFNRNRQSSPLELELTSAIEHISSGSFLRLKAIRYGAMHADGSYLFEWDDSAFNSVWNKDRPVQVVYLIGIQENAERLSQLLKQLMFILKPLYDTVSYLVVRSRGIMEHSLTQRDDHQPHIGLLLSFLHLYRHVRADINRLPERQLKFYFEQVLGMRPLPRRPDRLWVVFQTDPLRCPIRLPKGEGLIAGQDAQGQPRRYALERDVVLSGAAIRSLRNLFVARNPKIDQNSRFQMVTGLYCREMDLTPARPAPWSALGEDQRFLPPSEKTMEDAQMGFAIASPTLRLRGGERIVDLRLRFSEGSFHYLTDILMDISNRGRLRPSEVFESVFTGSCIVSYTSPLGWVDAADTQFLTPEDWDARTLVLRVRLSKAAPSMTNYVEEVHQLGLQAGQPMLRVMLNPAHAYHPYTHLQFLELDDIEVNVQVNDLRHLHLHSSTGALDDAGPFEILGAAPKRGSFLLIGNDEVFCKKLDSLQVGWSYLGLPLDESGLKGYFAAYPYGITNASFKLRVSALSDHRFFPRDDQPDQVVDMFESVKRSKSVKKDRLIDAIEIDKLNIRHDPDLTEEYLESYSSRKALGWLKLELIAPSMGFGTEVFADVYNASIAQSAEAQATRRGRPLTLQRPRDPFTPLAEQPYLNYTASSRLIFSPSRSFQNDVATRDAFYHLMPFGHARVFSKEGIHGTRLLPYLQAEGSLFIGLANLRPGDPLNLLFELEPNDKWSAGKRLGIQWSYLSHDSWKAFPPEKIFYDETHGLIHSGVLSLELPRDITDDNLSMGEGLLWIAATCDRKAELLSRIRHIHPDASAALFLDDGSDPDHPVSMPAGSLTEMERYHPEILGIRQPLPSTDGRPHESRSLFNQRVSEVLRHKNRAITAWDMEKMLLQQFDWLASVRVFGHSGHEGFVEPGQVVVAALPHIRDAGVFYQPLLDPGQILRMEEYLREASSPFVRITVRNPTYEYIWVKGRLMIDNEEVGATLKRLHEDILAYLCPWFYGQPQLAMNLPNYKRSELLEYIQSRPYIRFVTGFSIARMYTDDEGKYHLHDSAREENNADEISPAYPWSLLVPLAGNRIDIIHEAVYHAPEPCSLEDLVIGSNLILSDDFEAAEERPKEPARPTVSPTDVPVQYSFMLKL
ncbi:MAG: hypothetical protein FJX89_06715 [Bacteroidetes bacterium]|nr:hypothetical protein [Bacteroidota bacterium]